MIMSNLLKQARALIKRASSAEEARYAIQDLALNVGDCVSAHEYIDELFGSE